MTLRVLASGSSSNCYILSNSEEALVIECGESYSSVLKCLDYDRKKIVGALVSHEHGDHSRHADEFLKASIPVVMSQGTSDSLSLRNGKPRTARSMDVVTLGGFRIMAFDTQHDCAEPLGFLINHDDMGTLLFATDTYYLKYRFRGLSHIMIECNYSRELIDRSVEDGKIPSFVRSRIMHSHMSLDTTVSTLLSNDLSNVSEIILLHLSGNNSDAELFRTTVENSVGLPVHIAAGGLEVPLSKVF